MTDSIFLKSPERIEALSMIMGLCLLVYTLGQRQLRKALLTQNRKIKNQLGKLTPRPTLRWILQGKAIDPVKYFACRENQDLGI